MGIALTGLSSVVTADEAKSDFEFSANVALTSNYIWRGVSLSDNDAVVQGGVDVGHSSGLYAGVWGSGIDETAANGADTEWDFYVGWSGEVGPIGVDVSWWEFVYDEADGEDSADGSEWAISGSYDLGPVATSLTYINSDDYDFDRVMLAGEMPVGPVTLSASYAWNDLDTDYEDWSVGVSTELEGIGFGLTYADTDIDNATDTEGDILAFTISKSL